MALRFAVQKSFARASSMMSSNMVTSRFWTAAAAVPRVGTATTRGFAADATVEPAPSPGAAAPTVMDKLISLVIVDPSGARRRINGMIGKWC